MGVVRGKAFTSGNSVAVRLPKEIAFAPGTELVIERQGDVVTIRPSFDAAAEKARLEALLDDLAAIGAPPGGVQSRDSLEPPDRPDL